jgi:dihydrolipoamide dehydrogenase
MGYQYDFAIIGAGPGGYVAAILAAKKGKNVLLIEREFIGGVCLNVGCIPTKALLSKSSLIAKIPELSKLGIQIDSSGFEYSRLYEYSREVVSKLTTGVRGLLQKNGVTVENGEATIVDPHTIAVGDQEFTAEKLIIATGARPVEIPGFEFDEKVILSSTGALMQTDLPRSIVIMGGGVIGLEFADLYATLGVEVTVVEMLDTIIAPFSADASRVVKRALENKGVRFELSTKAVSQTVNAEGVTLTCERDGAELKYTAEKLLVAVGRRPNTDQMDCESLGISLTDRRYIETDEYMQTSIPSVYAIGDITSPFQLAHVASHQGEIAVKHALGEEVNPFDRSHVPSVVYTTPEVAQFGVHTAESTEHDRHRFSYRASGKALAISETEGYAEVIVTKPYREIVGATVVGAHAEDLIHEILLASHSELLPEDIADMIHAHPTLSEVVMETMKDTLGEAVHH